MGFLQKRSVQIAGQAVVITALVGGTSAFVGMSRSVTVTVDGEPEEVRTFGRTVDDVLTAQGVETHTGDVVSPALDAAVARNMDITVDTLKDLTLTVDGVAAEEQTTAHTVGQALADLGVDPADADVSAALDAPLADAGEISVTTHKSVTVLADGERSTVDLTAQTAGDVIAAAGVSLDGDDSLSVPLDAPVATGQVIEVLRSATDEVTVEEKIEKPVKEKKTDKLVEGEKKVEEKGADGKRTVTYRVRTVNGAEVSREELEAKTLEEPKEEVVLIGTGDPADPDSYEIAPEGSASGEMTTAEIKAMLGGPGSNWYRIVECESTFNPRAVNRTNGKYFGLFQFGIPTWRGVGGSGNPADASPQEQFQRAKALQARYGWSQWECAGKVGIR